MKEFWNQRYAEEDFAYGKEPNLFFKNTIDKYEIKGKILLPAEGEGRNAVYASKKGLNVLAFDISIEGKRKAQLLANEENVQIDYQVGNLDSLDLIHNSFDALGLIFAHFPPPILKSYHQELSNFIKPGGIIILEGFSKNNLKLKQQNPEVGGPGNIDMLFSKEMIQDHFADFEIIQLEEEEVNLNEGQFHIGKGSVIRFVGIKK